FLNDSLAFNGYTLFAPVSHTTTWLIDNCGEVVHTWESDYRPGMMAYLDADGSLWRACRINSTFNAGGTGGRIEHHNWEGDLLWAYDYSGPDYHQHHDIEPLPNGHVLLIAWERHTYQEAIDAGRDPGTTPANGLWSERIVELKPVGGNQAEVVWMWRAWDHLVQDFDSTKANYGIVADHPGRIDINYHELGGVGNMTDWLHINAIDYNAERDEIMLSVRNFSEIWVIDHGTTTAEAAGPAGDLLWRWGNPAAYGRGTPADQQLFGQHDAHWIPEGHPGAGQVLVFNNGAGRPDGQYSTVEQIAPPLDADGHYLWPDDGPFLPEAPAWTYVPDPPFFAQRVSGAQRLPNGNTLICNGPRGHVFEVTPDGQLVWDYVNPVRNGGPVSQGTTITQNDIFRATRYAPDHPAFEGRDLTPQGPVELDPLPSDCVIYGAPVTAVAGPHLPEGIYLQGNLTDSALRLINESTTTLTVTLVSATGQIFARRTCPPGAHTFALDHLPKGMYFVHVLAKNGATHTFRAVRY
ncbi:MAG: hypothetical protein D6818_05045, partial [Bacteroidetes bacterium]